MNPAGIMKYLYSDKPNQTLWTANQIVKIHSDSVSVSGYICIQMQAGLKSEFDMPQATHTIARTPAPRFFRTTFYCSRHFDIVVGETLERERERHRAEEKERERRNGTTYPTSSITIWFANDTQSNMARNWSGKLSGGGKMWQVGLKKFKPKAGPSGIKCLLKVSTD